MNEWNLLSCSWEISLVYILTLMAYVGEKDVVVMSSWIFSALERRVVVESQVDDVLCTARNSNWPFKRVVVASQLIVLLGSLSDLDRCK